MKKYLAEINKRIPRTRNQINKFWLEENPKEYLSSSETEKRTQFLIEKVRKLNPDVVLEIGCNCGRNLNALHNAGFKRLNGIELNKKAIELLKEQHPNLDAQRIVNADVNKLDRIRSTNLTFSMAVLEHLPRLDFLSKLKTQYFITMEDERGKPRYWYFKHNYKKVFESFGYEQIEEEPLTDIIGEEFTYRLFCFGSMEQNFMVCKQNNEAK